jgi:hypothetical protein
VIPCGGRQAAPLALGDLAPLPDASLIVNRWPTLPMHGTAELDKGLEIAIKHQLGLK